MLPSYRANWDSFHLVLTPVHEWKALSLSAFIPAADSISLLFFFKKKKERGVIQMYATCKGTLCQ